jgi:hypothetical protein
MPKPTISSTHSSFLPPIASMTSDCRTQVLTCVAYPPVVQKLSDYHQEPLPGAATGCRNWARFEKPVAHTSSETQQSLPLLKERLFHGMRNYLLLNRP